jgi:anti-anti-sigma factor
MSTPKTFSAETEGQTLIVVPLVNVSGLAEKDVKPELDHLLKQLEETALRNVVVDFAQISYFGTTMLEVLHRIWNCVRQAGGRMALCNVSAMQREVLHVAAFDTLWPICSSRHEAIETVTQ